ncbi:uncharacterized protein LOC124922161 [Impatiens glandulifera]|uniref:uncharacterized protein LOC124922161 n=1 Tax=Impatiens glandulifera TaxID=253017 RepID=UPI001FB19B1A|nr:uncharacterized protein LOC124922161 [Impatiens glandulifera]
MANPRRASSYISNHLQGSESNGISININNSSSSSSNINNTFQPPQTLTAIVTSIKHFLKKPHAFPILLSFFLLLTWLSLRFQHSSNLSSPRLTQQQQISTSSPEADRKANLVRFAARFPSPITKDKRGWLADPLSLAQDVGLSEGAVNCASVHLGEIQPGGLRGNHRHYTCNETFIIWGAQTIFRLENNDVENGYAEVTIGADEVAVATSPRGTAHAMKNIDPKLITFFVACQDSVINYNDSTSFFNVWKDF